LVNDAVILNKSHLPRSKGSKTKKNWVARHSVTHSDTKMNKKFWPGGKQKRDIGMENTPDRDGWCIKHTINTVLGLDQQRTSYWGWLQAIGWFNNDFYSPLPSSLFPISSLSPLLRCMLSDGSHFVCSFFSLSSLTRHYYGVIIVMSVVVFFAAILLEAPKSYTYITHMSVY